MFKVMIFVVQVAGLLPENHMSLEYRYIDSIQPIGINEIIADIKLIYAAYLIFAVAVKSESRKIRLSANKKGKSR
jgi:hypothetical protein